MEEVGSEVWRTHHEAALRSSRAYSLPSPVGRNARGKMGGEAVGLARGRRLGEVHAVEEALETRGGA